MPLRKLAPFKTPRKAAAAQVAKLANVPAPVGGLNLRDPISAMQPTDAVVLDNMIPRQTGVELRKGYRISVDDIGYEVKSVFSYNAPDSADNKVFAAANGAIYDVTSNPASVAQAATGSTNDIWWTTQFTTPADTFLLAVSPGAGYWTYSTSSGWINRTPSGLPTTTLRTVSVWKQRVFFTAEEDAHLWYMNAVNSVTGACTGFHMGSLLRNGGYLSAALNWTLDAGTGIDDHLVVIGTQGDVGVWTGTDPSSANTFALKGVWYIGPVPKYGKYFTAFGGDVLILSEMGLIPVGRMVNGQFVEADPGVSSKIQTTLSPLVKQLRDEQSWDVFVAPSDDVLIIKLPKQIESGYKQFVMNLPTGSWCTFSNMPMKCATVLNGQMYFGTDDGDVCLGLYGPLDAVASNGTGGSAIEGDVQTSFQSFDTPGQLKRFGLCRPIFNATEAPSIKLRVNTQYAFQGVEGSPSFVGESLALWDSAIWNTAVWYGGTNTYESWVGANGMGYYGSIRMKVRGKPGTLFLSSHISVEVGGMM
jgi:hypothetical protein